MLQTGFNTYVLPGINMGGSVARKLVDTEQGVCSTNLEEERAQQ
jgi:hypothetical protein